MLKIELPKPEDVLQVYNFAREQYCTMRASDMYAAFDTIDYVAWSVSHAKDDALMFTIHCRDGRCLLFLVDYVALETVL